MSEARSNIAETRAEIGQLPQPPPIHEPDRPAAERPQQQSRPQTPSLLIIIHSRAQSHAVLCQYVRLLLVVDQSLGQSHLTAQALLVESTEFLEFLGVELVQVPDDAEADHEEQD